MARERLINRRQQGDLGEGSAVEWLMSRGATVLIPFGHSPDYDLVAELGGDLIRIQVKTSTQHSVTPEGHARCPVSLVTSGGNQSWTGVTKRADPSSFDYLFVLVGSGRRWLIPAPALDARNSITLGGPKYAEYEIDCGRPIDSVIYETGSPIESSRPGEYPSGQRMAAVNRPAQSFAGSNPASPIEPGRLKPLEPTRYERRLGQSGQAVINQKRRMTIPQQAFFGAGFEDGSTVRVRADGPGRIVAELINLPSWARAEPST